MSQDNDPVPDAAASAAAGLLVGGLMVGAAALSLYRAFRKAKAPPEASPAAPAPPAEEPARAAEAPVRSAPAAAVPAAPARPSRPRFQAGDRVEGQVVGMITLVPVPRKLIRPAQEVYASQIPVEINFGGVPVPYYPKKDYIPAEYGPPLAKFVFVITEYPSGPVTNAEWERWGEAEPDILWTSSEFPDPSNGQLEVPETPLKRAVVDGVAAKALEAGWEPAGQGHEWYMRRFRNEYRRVHVPLKWR